MSRRKDKVSTSDEDQGKMSKEQETIAKFIRFNCPTSTTMFEGNEVHYFSGCKAVDVLWESKYGSKNTKNPQFKTRDECFHYISNLFSKQIFFRAKKLVAKKKEEKEAESGADVNKSPKKGAEKRATKKAKDEETETEAEDKKKDKETDGEDDKKKKKKVKLLVHPTQVFVDDKDVYVWIFDPTPLYKKIIGVMMLLGTIVGCLFPLWPMWLRQGVYYLSLGGIGVFASIIVVAILRTILFGIIYAATMGQHKLWILPNLTEDCGVLESFQPWYTYEHCPRDGKTEDKKDKKKDGKDKKKSKKDKDSDAEVEQQDEEETPLVANEAEDKDDDAEEDKQSSSIEDDYEKVDGEEQSELSDEEEAVPSSTQDTVIRKRRPAKV